MQEKTLEEMDNNVLNLHSDSDLESVKSDSDTTKSNFVPSNSVPTDFPIAETAKNEVLSLLKEICNSQTSLCTKDDLQRHSQAINKRFCELDQRVSTNASSLTSMVSRMDRIEMSVERSKYEPELA